MYESRSGSVINFMEMTLIDRTITGEGLHKKGGGDLSYM